ncbi:MAG: glycosyltransferase family 2 protein [Bryobacteraceae bacterium]|nr:glycosyltransferase family 2 protein [Bryobacteraceae bacterium]
MSQPDISVVIVSFNTREVLRECLQTLQRESTGLIMETFVVDNNSRDNSAEMVESDFPWAGLRRSKVNLGFAGANNVAFKECTGRYVVLLNSDAFVKPGALQLSVQLMDANPRCGLGGGLLVGRDGAWQPSARLFPSVLNDLLTISGLSAKYASSKFFGRYDRTWADPGEAAEVDWVPGAYSIIRKEALDQAGFFDEDFFLYYEEVDLCYRIKQAGWTIWYWPGIVVVHLGGESSKTVTSLRFSNSGAQLTLWRIRSGYLYYRKHHGSMAVAAKLLEEWWHRIRAGKNSGMSDPDSVRKREDSEVTVELLRRAWKETNGGRLSPARPW